MSFPSSFLLSFLLSCLFDVQINESMRGIHPAKVSYVSSPPLFLFHPFNGNRHSPRKTPSKTQRPILVKRILDILVSRRCVIIGTVYKNSPLRPTVLQEYEKEVNVVEYVCACVIHPHISLQSREW